ncbi:3-hydroxyacyl-ACP dehydratase [bacterium]|nr:MAG: 3-hydroxyacyl-ACP dehydratase [bacterium]
MNEMKKAIMAAALTPLEHTDDGAVACDYRFDEGFPGFSGHFPGYPIVPAIVQIMTARALIEDCHGAPLRLLAVEGAKFMMQLRPGEEIRVTCRQKEEHSLVYRALLSVGMDTAASFVLCLATDGEVK